MKKEDKFYSILAITGIMAYIALESTKPTYAINSPLTKVQVVLIAIGTGAAIFVILYGLLKAWENKLNKEKK